MKVAPVSVLTPSVSNDDGKNWDNKRQDQHLYIYLTHLFGPFGHISGDTRMEGEA